MWSAFKFFDAYTLKARIFPALIAGFPTLALPFLAVRWDSFGLSNVILVTTSVIMLYAFSNVARRRGLHVEKKLGSRATPQLWHHENAEIPNVSKDRYKEFIALKLKRPFPSKDDEEKRTGEANDYYNAAAAWLRDNTRDKKKFNLLFEDLMAYGFWRNLLGLKIPALVLNTFVFIISLYIYIYKPKYFSLIPNIDEKIVAIFVILLLHSTLMMFWVKKTTVLGASRSYGKQLLFSCETLMKGSRTPAKKPAQKPSA